MRIKELKGNKGGSLLVLADAREERFLPIRLGEPSARAMALELAGANRSPSGMQDLLANTLKYMNGTVKRVEVRWEDRPGYVATMVIDQEGKDVRFPVRIADGMALAHRFAVPIFVDDATLRKTGIGVGETGAHAAAADWMEAWRLTIGFRALGKTDDAILACRRLLELAPESTNDSWRGYLGAFYKEKGYMRGAAMEYYRTIRWHLDRGYVAHAVLAAREMAELDLAAVPAQTLRAPAVIEDFASPATNHEWMGGPGEVVAAPGRATAKAFRLPFDCAKEGGEWFVLSITGTQTWERAKAVTLDVYLAVKGNLDVPLPLRLEVFLAGVGEGKYRSTPQDLRSGWNRLVFTLADPQWSVGERTGVALAGSTVGPVTGLCVILQGDHRKEAGEIAITNFKIE